MFFAGLCKCNFLRLTSILYRKIRCPKERIFSKADRNPQQTWTMHMGKNPSEGENVLAAGQEVERTLIE